MADINWASMDTAPQDGTECQVAFTLAEDEVVYYTGLGVFEREDEDGQVWMVANLDTKPFGQLDVWPDFWAPVLSAPVDKVAS